MAAKVLVIEGHVLVARDLQARLESMGYEVVGIATEAEEAVKMAVERDPDLVLMDLNLRNDMDGVQAAVEINRQRSIPIIFSTAYSGDRILARDEAASLGGYVLKPFDNRELGINIEVALVRHRVEKELREAKQGLEATLANVSGGVMAADADGVICLVNPMAEQIAGLQPGEGLGKKLDEVLQLEAFEVGRVPSNLLNPGEFASWKQVRDIRHRLIRADGVALPIELSASFPDKTSELIVVTFRDISRQLGYEEAIRKDAFFDSRTELPGKALFEDRLSVSIGRRINGGEAGRFAVLLIGLDEFVVVTEVFGHDASGRVIGDMSRRIVDAVRPDDIVSWFGEDIFAVLLNPVESVMEVIKACEDVLDSIRQPMDIDGRMINVTAFIGIAIDHDDYAKADEVMFDADTALTGARTRTQGAYIVADQTMHREARQFIEISDGIQEAMIADSLEIYYQPVLAVESEKLIGMTSQVRWYLPEESSLSRDEQMSIAEAAGLASPLDAFLLRSVCHQMSRWHGMGFDWFRVTVSVNALQFESDIVTLVREALDAAGLSPSTLNLEISGELAMDNPDRNASMLRELELMGVSISMADFGTDHAPLFYLRRFPLASLKISRSLIEGLHDNEDDKELTRAIIGMGKSLRLTTMAEGVTNREQVHILRRYGCDQMQGLFCGESRPTEDMTRHLGTLI